MSSYHRMSVAQKQARHRQGMREPAVVCPVCETQTTAADLVHHVETRCPGQRDPNPHSKWITWREARALGVAKGTLSRWIRKGNVRTLGEFQDRRYLLRDIAQRIAQRRANRRR